MRDWGELRAMALHRWTGNLALDARGVTPDERECFDAAWHAESQRRFEMKDRARRILDRNN